MERLLYSGLMFAAGMLSLWTGVLLTATLIALAPALRKSSSSAATISSTRGRDRTVRGLADRRSMQRLTQSRLSHHGAEKSTSARTLSQTLS